MGPLLGLLLSLASHGASPDASCLLNALSDAEEQVIYSATLTARESEMEPVAQIIVPALEACQERHGWSGLEAQSAFQAALSSVLRQRAVPALAANDVSSAAIDRWFAGLEEPARASLEMSSRTEWSLMSAMDAVGIGAEKYRSNETVIGAYVASLILAERVTRGLPIE